MAWLSLCRYWLCTGRLFTGRKGISQCQIVKVWHGGTRQPQRKLSIFVELPSPYYVKTKQIIAKKTNRADIFSPGTLLA